jgi:DNA-binding transcriptional LysR family regulator
MGAQWIERLKLRQLRAVLAVEEHGSVTRAAEHLFVTQAAVSKVIAELEAQIGAPLFERQGRGIVATEAGRHVIQAARRIAGELRSLSDEVELATQGGSGILVIGMQAVSIVHLLPKVLAAMKARYPRVTIRLVEDTLAVILRDLRGGRIDFALGRMLPHLLGTDLDGFRMPPVPYVVVASPGHPLLTDPAPTWETACAGNWAMPLPGAPVRAYFSDFLAARGLALPTRVIEVGSPPLLAGILGASPILALVPLPMAEDWCRAGICEICPLDPSLQMEPIGLIWSTAIPLKPSARLFHAEILAQLSSPAER